MRYYKIIDVFRGCYKAKLKEEKVKFSLVASTGWEGKRKR